MNPVNPATPAWMHAGCMHTEGMRAIQVRNVPEDVHATLQRRAATSGQSLQEYLLALLREHASKPTLDEWLAEAGSDSGGSLSFEEAVAWQREERGER